jgi:glycine dehydrogenase subunit 1
MLERIGVSSVDALFAQIIPERLRLGRALDLPASLDEAQLLGHLGELAAMNFVAGAPVTCADGATQGLDTGREWPQASHGARASLGAAGEKQLGLQFLGAGVYPHAIPTAVDMQISRAEWYTSYTPYQPEISQGTLQAMFEYQTITAEMLGLDVANASMYDGSTGCAEAVLMARRLTGKKRAIVSASLHPEYRAVTASYLQALPGGELAVAPIGADGRTDLAALAALIAAESDLSCVVLQSPNFFGAIEDLREVAALVHARGALLVGVCTEPVALGMIEPPGKMGADIAVGEGIGLGIPPTLGGPGCGLFAARAEHVRALPGRLVGETVENVEGGQGGRRGYVLTLATREQHIRREKATSNICTNTGLVALAFTIHMCLLGRRGIAELARLCHAKAEYAKGKLLALPGFSARFGGKGFAAPTFSEFAVRVPGGDAAAVVKKAGARGVFPGVAIGRWDAAYADTLLVSINETHRREDIDKLASVLGEVTK